MDKETGLEFEGALEFAKNIPKAEIGIIGGTGVYDPRFLEETREVRVDTPFGPPSDAITLGVYKGRNVAILPRHGKKHTIPPHRINYRANIFALKKIGVEQIISPCAVGSLQDYIKPGEFVLVDQFIDRTHGRESSFYDESRVCHISVADPVCPDLTTLARVSAKKLGLRFNPYGTYVCIQGPRFSTRAESRMFRGMGAHVIGMTLVPECVLAREAEICYLSIATVTDYDTFKEQSVSIEQVVKTMKENEDKLKALLTDIIPKIPKVRNCPCKDALRDALL